MALRPLDKKTGYKRPVNEDERKHLLREQEKSDWNKRNK